MTRLLISVFGLLLTGSLVKAQPCNPSGNQATYGNNNNWRAYVYDNTDFTNYRGTFTINGPDFDHNFGGNEGSFTPPGGCAVTRTTFSVRFRLQRNFTAGGYRFTVGGDDGFRLSVDGGNTWIINAWQDQAYHTETHDIYLSGTVNLVLEYYENAGDNRISFNVSSVCMGSENTSVYGINNIWNAYIYDGTNFNYYLGRLQAGTTENPNFDQDFGGSNANLNTSSCATTTETFSVRYRLRREFAPGTYQFTVGGDDGYRLSIDGGSSWIINNWNDHAYTSTVSLPIQMDGTYDMVLEYYENGGDNRVSFELTTITLLPTYLIEFKATLREQQPVLSWITTRNSRPDYFEIQRSEDGRSYKSIGMVTVDASALQTRFSYTDRAADAPILHYRLKMVDIDRSATYSKSIIVRLQEPETGSIQVYPTVISGQELKVKTSIASNNAELIITDLNGMIVLRRSLGKLSANQAKSVDISRLASNKGIYLVRITTGNGIMQTSRIMIR